MRRARPQDDPWTIPVPVRSSCFTPLDRAHARFNIEVDLGAIGAFFEPRADELGHADFQLLPDAGARGRLGAGRAVHYRGHYLKGVGRTPLAANWAFADDRRHATGHLFASAAVREYLISRFCEAHGLGDAIVPCTGVLVRPLPRGGRAAAIASMPRREPVPAIDLRFQAISVKPGGFARLSNVTWALHHPDVLHRQIAELALALQRVCDPSSPLDPSACSPRSVIAALAAAIERTLVHQDRYFAAGVHWGYLDNNITADGRFLDLEVPGVVGAASFGVLQGPGDATRAGGRWIGLEPLDVARRLGVFVEDLRARLAFLAGSSAMPHPLARRFAAELARELDAAVPRTHVIRSARAQRIRLEAGLAATLALGPRARASLRALIAARQRYVLDRTDAPVDVALRDVALDLAIHTPGVGLRFRQPAWAPAADDRALAIAAGYNAAVRRADAAPTIDRLFDDLRRGARAIASSARR